MNEKIFYRIAVLVGLGLIIFIGPMVSSDLLQSESIGSIPLIYIYFCFFWL